MSTTFAVQAANCFLKCLSDDSRQRLAPHLYRLDVRAGQVLLDREGSQNRLFFPLDSVVSLLYLLGDGTGGEIAVVGREGLIGTRLLTNVADTPTTAVVQTAGTVLAVDADVAAREFRRNGSFQRAVMRHIHWLIAQISQSLACNRHHAAEKQVARWLLNRFDRTGVRQVSVTHDGLAMLLGVRRETVTQVAAAFQAVDFIRCGRGRIEIVDRQGLLGRSCECYGAITQTYDRLFGT